MYIAFGNPLIQNMYVRHQRGQKVAMWILSLGNDDAVTRIGNLIVLRHLHAGRLHTPGIK